MEEENSIKRIIDLWANDDSMFGNPYEVKKIVGYKKIKQFYLVKLDCLYHDFAWGIGEVACYAETKYLSFPEKLVTCTDEEIKLWFEHKPQIGYSKSPSWKDISYKYDLEKELLFLQNPDAIQERIKEIEKQIAKYNKELAGYEKLNAKLKPLAIHPKDFEFMGFIAKNGKEMFKL